MRTLNLGILAHVDAGKTSLTERILYAAGVIDAIGAVDQGTTTTDFLPLERQRGITIKSAVASFVADGVVVNLIDTPGHPDFIAEVERALSVLDGAVLVISAVEGVQAQTRVVMGALRRLGIATAIFVNKIDRAGADPEGTLADISRRLTPAIIAMGRVAQGGSRSAEVTGFAPRDRDFRTVLTERVAEADESILRRWLDDAEAIPDRLLWRALIEQTGRAIVYPVFFGSAITGAGVAALMRGVTALLTPRTEAASAPVSGTIFKVERGARGEKIAFVRMRSGALRIRERVRVGEREQKITAISVFDRGAETPGACLSAGRIGKVWGLGGGRIGDVIGEGAHSSPGHHFTPPTLETLVVPRVAGEKGRLLAALHQLAEQDPLINLRQDDPRGEIFISLYGEVQKEVIGATLVSDFGLGAEFRETTTICVERVVGTGAAVQVIAIPPNPWLATVGLTVAPGPFDSGVVYQLAGSVLGTMPLAFFNAVEEAVLETLLQGPHGWAVIDCQVTLTHTGYWPRQSHAHATFDKAMSSTASDFRNLTRLMLASALTQAGTRVCEPVHAFRLEVPADLTGPVASAMANLGATPRTADVARGLWVVNGEVPSGRVHALQQRLPALTRGEGLLEAAFEHYRPVNGPAPTRPRTDQNPFNREAYLRNVGLRR